VDQRRIQTLAFEYIQNRVNCVQSDIECSENGISKDEVETFIGWFSTYDDFKQWAINESNWGREELANLTEIFELIGQVMHV
jgi:hypothetical protein